MSLPFNFELFLKTYRMYSFVTSGQKIDIGVYANLDKTPTSMTENLYSNIFGYD